MKIHDLKKKNLSLFQSKLHSIAISSVIDYILEVHNTRSSLKKKSSKEKEERKTRWKKEKKRKEMEKEKKRKEVENRRIRKKGWKEFVHKKRKNGE